MSGVGITYLWASKEFPSFVRLEGKRGDYEVYVPERTCEIVRVGNTRDVRKCSACNKLMHFDHPLDRDCLNYCPNCGSKVIA